MSIKEQMEQIYRDIALQDIPWNNPAAPELLVSAVTGRMPRPRTVIELGCGAGNNVTSLARLGFDVTGVDIAENAVAIACESARRAGVACRFVAADVLGDLAALAGPFDLAYDWELLHHIFPEDRQRYVANVGRLLRADGTYLSVCFSEDDPQFGGMGKYRKTPIGTELYFSSEREVESLVSRFFAIDELKTIDLRARRGSHRAIFLLARKRAS
ncbi:MAG: class I SAM-dependent methyltransferase [Gemmatimonadales bacterium]|jgi:SAM-dependent methyltransferase